MTSQPLISCLCVTEGRSAFSPWLLWGFQRQTWTNKELVVIDSSARPLESTDSAVRVIRAPTGTNIPTKRNLALNAARGELVAWFDDDDWQHPQRLELLAPLLVDRTAFAGPSQSWFVDLFAERCRRYEGRSAIIFNSALFRRDLAQSVRFDENRHRASDTVWLRELAQRGHGERVNGPALALWLCHDSNISNPRQRRAFPLELDELRGNLGPEAWADTDTRLAELRHELPASAAASPAPFVNSRGAAAPFRRERRATGTPLFTRTERTAPRRGAPLASSHDTTAAVPAPAAPEPACALLVLALGAAEAVVELGVPHLLRQAGCPFAHRLLVQDEPSPTGKTLVTEGAIDRLEYGLNWPEAVADALARAPEFTLVAYPGEVFFTASSSWVLDACAELQRGSCDALCSQTGPLERETRIVLRRAQRGRPQPALHHAGPRAFVLRTSALLKYLRSGDGDTLRHGPASAWHLARLRRRSNWSLTLTEALKSAPRRSVHDSDAATLAVIVSELESGNYRRSFTL